jgi:hypothetical protein
MHDLFHRAPLCSSQRYLHGGPRCQSTDLQARGGVGRMGRQKCALSCAAGEHMTRQANGCVMRGAASIRDRAIRIHRPKRVPGDVVVRVAHAGQQAREPRA